MHDLFFANHTLSVEKAYATNTTATTSYISPFTNGWERFVYVLYAGAVGTTLDAKIVQATDSSGTSSKNVTDVDSTVLAITQLTSAYDGYLVTLEIGPGALDAKNGFDHIALTVTAAGSCDWGVFGLYSIPRFANNFTHETEYLSTFSAALLATGTALTRDS